MSIESSRSNASEYGLFTTQVLNETSEIAKRNFGKVSGSSKAEDNNQVLTETDIEIGNFIVSRIQKAFPDHNIIDEEAGVINKDSEYTWVVDPIDGTSNYAAGSPLHGTIIGLIKNNEAILGGVALPQFDEIYIAEKGTGAYCNGKRLEVTGEKDLKNALVGYSIDGHQENPQITYDETRLLADIILGCRNLRASGSVFDAMLVAKGVYGAYHHRNTKIWDITGLKVIIEEAGGRFTNFNGEEIDFDNHLERAKDKYPFCTASPALHKQLQEIIHRA